MCYPYGAYNDSVITKLEKYHFSVGLSTKPEVSVLNKSNRYELGRIDTNEIMPLISK